MTAVVIKAKLIITAISAHDLKDSSIFGANPYVVFKVNLAMSCVIVHSGGYRVARDVSQRVRAASARFPRATCQFPTISI